MASIGTASLYHVNFGPSPLTKKLEGRRVKRTVRILKSCVSSIQGRLNGEDVLVDDVEPKVRERCSDSNGLAVINRSGVFSTISLPEKRSLTVKLYR